MNLYKGQNFPLEGVMLDTISKPNDLFTVDGTNWPSLKELAD